MRQEGPDILRVSRTKKQTASYYDRISRIYDLLAKRSEDPARKIGLKSLKVQSGESVVEIGFGTGNSLVHLAKAVGPKGRVFGIDSSKKMCQISDRRLKLLQLSDRAQIGPGDATELPYPNQSMDAIFMSFTLELFDTPEIPKVLAECKRVLRPNGRIGVVGMTREGKARIGVAIYEWLHKHFPSFMDCRPIHVRTSLERGGFAIELTKIVYLWLPVEIVIARNPGESFS